MAAYKITVSANGGSGGLASFYFDSVTQRFYETSDFTHEPLASLPMHVRTNYASLGYRSSASDTATVRVNQDGTFADGWAPSSSVTIYARWTQVSYTVTVSANGGEADAVFYAKKGASPNEFFADDLCTIPIAVAPIPPYAGHGFLGAWSTSSASGGTEYIGPGGVILDSLASRSFSAALTVYARWEASAYTLTFDYAGGSEGEASKRVTFGVAIGDLPAPTKARHRFAGWKVDGSPVTASTVWSIPSDATATASYEQVFGSVTDYFGLASNVLIPVESSDGSNRRHACAYNATSENPATATSAKWLNPSVTYEVVGAASVSIMLGRGYACETDYPTAYGNKVTKTGYMIVSAELVTSVGTPPRLTVSAVANEGFVFNITSGGSVRHSPTATNAVKTYTVTIPVTPRHRAQDAMSAFAINGYELLECRTVAACDPVVVAEDDIPCASDVCHGRIETSARFAAYGDAASLAAGTGFVLVGEPMAEGDTVYASVTATARKELN